MATIRCTLKELRQGIAVPLDERTKIIVSPDAALATIVGRMFDPGKTFPLPRALRALQDAFGFVLGLPEPTAALVVGHVNQDTEDADTLSLERAKVLAAWLLNDPQPWIDQYGEGIAEEKRWGPREDRAMLRQVSGLSEGPPPASTPSAGRGSTSKQKDELVRRYQALRGLQTDGIAGPITRKALVLDYFAASKRVVLADTDAADDPSQGPQQLDVEVSSHGAGDHFTLDDVELARKRDKEPPPDVEEPSEGPTTSAAPGPKPGNDAEPRNSSTSPSTSVAHERLDFFFFFSNSGVDPVPSAPDGEEYLDLIALATRHKKFSTGGKDSAGAQLSVQLLDKHGTVTHGKQRYEITGPEDFTGVTDSLGRIDVDDVSPGDYQLKLFLEFFDGAHRIVDEHTAALVVLPGVSDPQIRKLGVVPRVVMARIRGLLFDTNKAFLLPSALEDMKSKIRPLYEANNPSELLVVGHTDTTADAATNDPLSLERAKSTLAFLQDDVDAWLAFYGSGVPQSRRWGDVEDEHMLEAVLSESERVSAGGNLLQFFRDTRSISETGPASAVTRGRLITEYMRLDGAELDAADLHITATAHGCGENFPVDDTGEELDSSAADDKEDALDRRVELFFFDTEFGVAPKPAGQNSKKGSTEYPVWRRQAKLLEDAFPPALIRGDRFAVRLLDLQGKPLESETEVAFSVTAAGKKIAAGIAIDAWAVFRVPVDAGNLVDIVWGAAGATVRFARRVDLSSSRPPDPGLSAARLGSLGFPVREGGDCAPAAQGYQATYELADADGAVIDHMENVYAAAFEAPHPTPAAASNDEDEVEVEPPPDSGLTEFLEEA